MNRLDQIRANVKAATLSVPDRATMDPQAILADFRFLLELLDGPKVPIYSRDIECPDCKALLRVKAAQPLPEITVRLVKHRS